MELWGFILSSRLGSNTVKIELVVTNQVGRFSVLGRSSLRGEAVLLFGHSDVSATRCLWYGGWDDVITNWTGTYE